MTPHVKIAFSWTELLVLIAVLGFLGAVLIPYLNRGHAGHGRSVDASNIRQMGQAALIYANDNREKLPGLNLNQAGEIDEKSTTPNIHAIAAALAREGGLNDANLWTFQSDSHPDVNRTTLTVVLERGPPRTVSPDFAGSALSVQFVAGLETKLPSTTPIAFTRGLQTDGRWAGNRQISVYGSEGGHIVFLGGNVMFYQDLRDGGGQLVARSGGTRTANILETIDAGARIFSHPPTATGALDGMPGIAP